MLVCIILFWVLTHLSAPMWCFVLLVIAAFIRAVSWGMELTQK